MVKWEKQWVTPQVVNNSGINNVMATLGCRPGFIVKPSPYPTKILKWVQVKEIKEEYSTESVTLPSETVVIQEQHSSSENIHEHRSNINESNQMDTEEQEDSSNSERKVLEKDHSNVPPTQEKTSIVTASIVALEENRQDEPLVATVEKSVKQEQQEEEEELMESNFLPTEITNEKNHENTEESNELS